MANLKPNCYYRSSSSSSSSSSAPSNQNQSATATVTATVTAAAGVCMMNTTCRDEQHPSFIDFIASFLNANSYRLNFLPIAPDFIFNCGGLSVAFIFVTKWNIDNVAYIFER
ncbi:hypothetical protein ACFE04_004494 [Oxalis oulophora]